MRITYGLKVTTIPSVLNKLPDFGFGAFSVHGLGLRAFRVWALGKVDSQSREVSLQNPSLGFRF